MDRDEGLKIPAGGERLSGTPAGFRRAGLTSAWWLHYEAGEPIQTGGEEAGELIGLARGVLALKSILGPADTPIMHFVNPVFWLGYVPINPDGRAFVQGQDVAEVGGEALQEGQLVRAGIAEDGGDAIPAEQIVGEVANGRHDLSPKQLSGGRYVECGKGGDAGLTPPPGPAVRRSEVTPRPEPLQRVAEAAWLDLSGTWVAYGAFAAVLFPVKQMYRLRYCSLPPTGAAMT